MFDPASHPGRPCLGSTRAAFLVGTGLAVLLNKMDRPAVTIGVDGSVYRYHPHVHRLMCEQISKLVRPGMKVNTASAAGRVMLGTEGRLGKDAERGDGVRSAMQASNSCWKLINRLLDSSLRWNVDKCTRVARIMM